VGELLSLAAVVLTGLFFYRVWVVSLRTEGGDPGWSSSFHWDLERPEKWINGNRIYDVKRAKQLIHDSPREVKLVDVSSIQKRFDADRLGVDLLTLSELPIRLDFPLILVPEGNGVLIIDGWHRVARAIQSGVLSLPAVWLSESETQSVLQK
jgi:hypothetical protein